MALLRLLTLDARCRELLVALYLSTQPASYADVAVTLRRPIGSIGPTRARCLAKFARSLRSKTPIVGKGCITWPYATHDSGASTGQSHGGGPRCLDEEGTVTGFREVLDWLEGRLDPVRGEMVAADVARDPELAACADWVRRFHDVASRSMLESPPPHVRTALRLQFSTAMPARPTILERVRAVIAFDTAVAGIAGVRTGAAIAGSLHIVLESPRYDLALDIYEEDDVRRVEGQVLPTDDELSAELRLLRSDGVEAAATTTDVHGGFAFEPVLPGTYALEISSRSAVVETVLELT